MAAAAACVLVACAGKPSEKVVPGGTSAPIDQGSSAESPPVQLTVVKIGDAVVAADGAPVTDANGVSVQVAPEALATDSGSGKAVVSTFKMAGELADALAAQYSIDSPVYSVEADGRQDSTGRAALVFPAPNADSRLVQIIDDRYLVPVNTRPADGKLAFFARMGPADNQGLEPAGSLRFDGSMRFVVITPKKTGLLRLAPAVALAQTTPGVDCSVVHVDAEEGIETGVSPCLANEDQTIKILWASNLKFSYGEAYTVAKQAEKWMKVYAGKDIGFSNADLSRYWFAMNIVIEAGAGDPQYNPKSGTVFMPLDFAKSIGSGAGSASLLHELGHWIQDESYKMCWAGLKTLGGADASWWWLEVAAENMVMLAKPEALTANMTTYGAITSADNALVWQKAVNQWPDEFYAQAQLVRVFMCASDACPLSEKTFVEAINKGSFPYNDEAALKKVGANLEDYARYLIGSKPQQTNTDISLDAVSAAGAFGENLLVTQKTGQSLRFHGGSGRQPQIAEKAQDGFDRLEFNASLEQNGVYPVTIIGDERVVGMPVMLTVEAGIPVVYRLDGGEVKTHGGDKPLIIGPISAKLGFKEARLAAYSSASGMTFKGSLKVIDLAGAWTMQAVNPTTPTSSSVVCDNPPADGTDKLHMMLPLYGNIAMSLGDFTAAGSADQLEWSFLSKRLPPNTDASDFNQNYSMTISPDDITIKGRLDIPQQAADRPSVLKTAAGLGGLPLGAVAWVGGAWLTRRWPRRRRRPVASGMVLVLLALLLAGCFSFFGKSTVDIKVTRLEASNGNADATWNVASQSLPDTVPIWTITEASGTYLIDSTTRTDSTPNLLADEKVYTTNHCTGTLVYDLKGGVYPDVTLVGDDQDESLAMRQP